MHCESDTQKRTEKGDRFYEEDDMTLLPLNRLDGKKLTGDLKVGGTDLSVGLFQNSPEENKKFKKEPVKRAGTTGGVRNSYLPKANPEPCRLVEPMGDRSCYSLLLTMPVWPLYIFSTMHRLGETGQCVCI
jgi:hypothetical protein